LASMAQVMSCTGQHKSAWPQSHDVTTSLLVHLDVSARTKQHDGEHAINS